MKTKNKKTQKISPQKATGLPEFLAALGIVVLGIILILCIRSCENREDISPAVTGAVFEDISAPADDTPTSTILTPIPADGISYPLPLTDMIAVEQIYTATGYFPEDGSDEAIENVLAVKLSNSSDRTLEYLSFSLIVNGEISKFTAATVPAGKNIYVFAAERSTAPTELTTIESAVEFEIYFSNELSAKTDTLSYEVQNGTIVVTNISDRDILSDIVVYYKSTAEDGYLGGITYRLRISGGLAAGESFNGYAPHAYAHMTEIMFTQYEE